MSKYEGTVVEAFTDLEDGGRVYYAGDTYPHAAAKAVSAERFKALTTDENKRGMALVKSNVTAEDFDTEVAADNYTGMTVSQLKDVAKNKGLDGYSHLKRSELIDLISK